MLDIIIIGAGTAGLTAALYARRAGLDVLVLESGFYGGQIANTPEVENYPAIPKISGFDFSQALYDQVSGLGAQVKFEAVTAASLTGEVKSVSTAKNTYEAKTVIVANGAQRRKLGCPGEEQFSGRGVSYCATCDGSFFRGKEVAIVGGGNTALEDAIYLAGICSKVYLIHRRDAFRGNDILVKAVESRPNIEICWNSVPSAITGDQSVTGCRLTDTKTGENRELAVSAVFVAIGLVPDNAIWGGAVQLDPSGYILAGEDCRTNLPGVFVAGDTRTKPLRQLVTAAADGAVAAFEAGNYLASLG